MGEALSRRLISGVSAVEWRWLQFQAVGFGFGSKH